MKINHNRHVLAVQSIEVTGDFFAQALGFREVFNDGNWRFMQLDDCVMMLGECPDAAPMQNLGDHQYFAYLNVDDADSFLARCNAAGAEVTSPIADKPWKMREFGVRTPDGHRIMIGHNL